MIEVDVVLHLGHPDFFPFMVTVNIIKKSRKERKKDIEETNKKKGKSISSIIARATKP